MTTFIPSKDSKKYSVANRGDLFGNILRTRNIDFTNHGYISLARKAYALMTETINASFESPICLLSDDALLYMITSNAMFTLDPRDANFAPTLRNSGTPPSFGFQSDAVFFNAALYASGTTSVCSYASSTWTSRITGLSSSYPHPLCVSEHQQYLAVGNGNTVALYNTSHTLVTTLTIPAEQIVTWIRWRGNLLFIGCRNTAGGDAKMFVWNGSGTGAQSGHGVAASWIFSGCIYGSSILVVTSTGQLLVFSGDGFTPLRTSSGQEVNLPVYYTGTPWGSSAAASNLNGKVSSRGMVAKGTRVFLSLDDSIEYTTGGSEKTLASMPGGLWVFDPDVGLYHRAGVDHKQRVQLQPSSVSSNTLTLPSARVFETGDAVYVASKLGLTGDIAEKIYYAIKVSSTQLKLAQTPQEAIDGVAITITGTPGSSDLIAFNVYESVGSTRMERAGGVTILSSVGMPRFNGSEVVFGGDVRTSTGTTIGSVCSLGMGKNVGSFITPKIQAQNVTDIFQKLITKFPPLNISTRKIIIKYRTANRWGAPGRADWNAGSGATWVDSDTFTINPKTYDAYKLAVGDEIEFTRGAAAGYTAHVASITQDSSTQWTINLDEAMPEIVVGDTSMFMWDNWTKYKTISTTDMAKEAAKGFANMALTKNAKWAQFKIELRGYTDIQETMDMEELMLVNGADQKYE